MRIADQLYYNLAGDVYHPQAHRAWEDERFLLTEGAEACRTNGYAVAIEYMRAATEDATFPKWTRWEFCGDNFACVDASDVPMPGMSGHVVGQDWDRRVFYLIRSADITFICLLSEEY